MPQYEKVAADPFVEKVPGNPFTGKGMTKRSRMNPVLRKADAAVRGAADMLTLGFADEIAAGVEAVPAFIKGGAPAYGEEFSKRLDAQQASDQADRVDVPVSRGAGQVAGFVGGLGLGALANSAVRLPQVAASANPLLGGAANAGYAAAEGAALGGLAAAGNADGDIPARARAAVPGAVVGGVLGGTLSPALGAAQAGVRSLMRRGADPVARTSNILAGRIDAPAARARTNILMEAGAEPSLVNVAGEQTKGYVRAAASRMTPARDVVQQRADAARLNLPDRIGLQARRNISDDPRNPEQVVADMTAARDAAATRNYAQVDELVTVPDAVKDMLSDASGRQIIARARADAIENQDWMRQAELDQLLRETQNGQLPRISASTIDRLVISARERAGTFAEQGMRLRARGAMARRGQLDATLDDVEALAPARADYAAQSRNIDAAEAGSDFLRAGSADEFAGAMGAASDLTGARATARRAVERAVGENVSAAPGVARRIADAPEQQMRNTSMLGPEGAERLQAGMRAEANVVQDLVDIAPRTGSQTQNKTADQETIGGIAEAVRTFAGGPQAWLGAAVNRLKTLGLSDADAQIIAEVATDPAQLQAVLNRLETAAPNGPDLARSVVSALNQSATKNVGENTIPESIRRGSDGMIEIDINQGNPNAPR